jgi:hypothetical protein
VGDWFKAALYVDNANHGQFNSVWGRADIDDFPGRGQLNLTPIMTQADQQQIAQVYLSAFLEATLKGQDGYRMLFKDYRTGRDWLPPAILISRYDGSDERILADFEEDVDVISASLSGAAFEAQAMITWYEKLLPLGGADQGSRAVFLGWDRSTKETLPRYCLSLPGLVTSPYQAVIFKLAAANTGDDLIDFNIVLQDQYGQRAKLPLSSYFPVQPQIVFQPYKFKWLNGGVDRSEIVFQRYAFNFGWFQASNPDFDAQRLDGICLVFDQSERGAIVLDEIGFGN